MTILRATERFTDSLEWLASSATTDDQIVLWDLSMIASPAERGSIANLLSDSNESDGLVMVPAILLYLELRQGKSIAYGTEVLAPFGLTEDTLKHSFEHLLGTLRNQLAESQVTNS